MERHEESNETRIEPEEVTNGLKRELELARETIARCENEREALKRDVVRERENLRQLGETLLTTTRNAEKMAQELNEARDEVKGTLELVSNLHEKNAELKLAVERKENELNELREETREYERRAEDANKAIELMCDLYVNTHLCSLENETCFFAIALGDGMANGRCVRLFHIERRTRGELARMARDMFRESCDAERRLWFDSAYGTANVLSNWCSPKVLRADRFHLPIGYTPQDFLDPNKDRVLNTAAGSQRFLLLKTTSACKLSGMLLERGATTTTTNATSDNEVEFSCGKRAQRAGGKKEDDSAAAMETDGGATASEEDEPAVRGNDSDVDEETEDDDDDDLDATTFTRNYVRRILRKKPRLCLALTLRPLTYKSPASFKVSPCGGLRRRAPLTRTASTVYYSTNTDATAGQVLRAIKELFESVAKTTQQRERNRTRYEVLRLLNSAKANPRSIARIHRDD